MQQLNIPIKKSKKQIESYLKHGKYFGNILKEIYDTLIIDNILKTSRDIELYFKELSEKYDPMVDYPFRDQINQEGKRFKAPICVSINDSVAHSRPKSTIKLKQNDIISVDCGLRIDNLMYDSAFTVVYNTQQPNWIKAPQKALNKISNDFNDIRGTDTKNISQIIEYTANISNLDIVTALAGHGIGVNLHEAPKIHNALGEYIATELFNGMVFCVEPIYVYTERREIKQANIFIEEDGWTIKTTNQQPSTHWETMYCVQENKLIDLTNISQWDI